MTAASHDPSPTAPGQPPAQAASAPLGTPNPALGPVPRQASDALAAADNGLASDALAAADNGPGAADNGRGAAGGDLGASDGPGRRGDDQWMYAESLWPAAPRPPRRPGRAAAVAAAICLTVAAFGAPLGLLWVAVAPTVPVRMTEDGPLLVDSQPEEFIAADGWFVLLGLAFGVLAAIAVWLVVRHRRGPLPLIAVTLGAVGAGLLAWWLGRQIGVTEYERLLESAPVGEVFGKPVDLRAADVGLWRGFLPLVRGDVLVPGFAAALMYTLLAGWSRYHSLRPELEIDPEIDPEIDLDSTDEGAVSWGSTATPAPPTAPAPPVPGEAAPPRD